MATYLFTGESIFPYTKHTLLDDHGAKIGHPRKESEDDFDYLMRLLDIFAHPGGATYQGIINIITREMNLAQTVIATVDLDSSTNSSNMYVEWGQHFINLREYLTDEILDSVCLYYQLPSAWLEGVTYSTGDIVFHPHNINLWLRCDIGGESGDITDFSQTVGDTITDNEITWTVINEYGMKTLDTVIAEFNTISGNIYTITAADGIVTGSVYAAYVLPTTSLMHIEQDVPFSRILQLEPMVLNGSLILSPTNILKETALNANKTSYEYSVDYDNGLVEFGSAPDRKYRVTYRYNVKSFNLIHFPLKLYEIFNDQAKQILMLPMYDSNLNPVYERDADTDEAIMPAYSVPTQKYRRIIRRLEKIYPTIWGENIP